MFSFRGRIGRLEYVGHRLVAAVILLFGFLLAKVLSGTAWSEPITAVVPRVFLAAFVIVAVAAVATASVRRCHDIGHGGLFVVLAVVPFVGFFVGLYLTFRRGQYGYNKWGYEGGGHPHLDGMSPRDLYLAEFG